MDFGLCRGINRTECKFDGGIGYAYIPIDGSIIGAGFGLGIYDFNLLKDPKPLDSYFSWFICIYSLFLY
jgi:hypothetical protein